jgi:hypothetical protein
MLVQISRECTPPFLSTGISNLLQPTQAEVVLGKRSTYLASWAGTTVVITGSDDGGRQKCRKEKAVVTVSG